MHTAISGTSSVGAAWPPTPTTHDRLRGFYPGVVDGAEASSFVDTFDYYRQLLLAQQELSRLTIRAVVHTQTLPAIEQSGVPIEAVIPLARTEPDLVIAYTGVNQAMRTMSRPHATQHRQLLDSLARRTPREMSTDSLQITHHRVTPDAAPHLVPDFVKLYEPFGYGEQDTAALLTDPHNTIAYIQTADGMVISTALAETASIPVSGLGWITVHEITEASTLPGYRGMGLYRRASAALLHELRHTTANAIYGESNLSQPGVVIAAYENGRTFPVATDYGLINPDFGILPQNFHIADNEIRRYNDFAVSHVPL